MIDRTLQQTIWKAAKTFPAVIVTGPRQSGKTTLLTSMFAGSHKTVSLEDPDVRIRAKTDPRAFLEQFSPPVLIDEIQYVPDLLSYIKTKIDAQRLPGQWILTGSQNFALMEGASQSLAGRAAVLTLLPLSVSELAGKGGQTNSVFDWAHTLSVGKEVAGVAALPDLHTYLLRGSYPEIATNAQVDRQLWCGSYIATYLERDVRNISRLGDLSQFERFLKLCATRTGQILNVSDLARDIGVSVPTARRWLSLLEASHQVYLLQPYYRNIGKRLVKSPKLYFIDTALATYLLGLHEPETLMKSPHLGNIFETMVVVDVLKRFYHSGLLPSMYYLRTRDGLEIDLVIETGETQHVLEIKSSKTITPEHALSLMKIATPKELRIESRTLVSATQEDSLLRKDIWNKSWQSALV